MTIEEAIDQLAHDCMQQRCHELYRVIDAQVKAGKGTEVILASHSTAASNPGK